MPFRDSHSCPILVADRMNNSLPNLANLPPDAQAYIVEQSALLAARDADILGLKQEVLGLTLNHAADQKRLKSKATTAQAALLTERTAHAQTIQSRDMIIADLRMQLDGHKKHRFGSRSESSTQLALELILEDHEIAQAAETADDVDNEAKPPRTPRVRKPFPKELKRVQQRITPSDTCEDCGGSFKELGSDVMEELEYIPAHYIVKQIERPRLACTCCEKIVQSEMPSRPIPKSFVGPALMAHIIACKYGYHLPLYRQSQMFENQGIEISGSLMCSWVGKITKLLERLSDAIRDHVFKGQAIFMDDTTVKLLQKGKGRGKNKPKTARLWDYARDERPWGSTSPPAVWYQFSTSRGAEHPSKHLETYEGFAHADAYAGYNDAYRTGRVKEMACMVHVRREFYNLFESAKLPVAGEAVARIKKLYDIEKKARFLPPAERVALRQEHAKPIFDGLETWLMQQLAKISRKTPLAKAIKYALARLPKARPYLEYGFLELDNNTAERGIRPVTLGRKNYLFMGSEAGGHSAAIAYTLIETCKMNKVNSEAWLAWVLIKIQDHPVNRMDELLPWAYQAMIDEQKAV
ncbi:MAG TPA: IS66 family transposase [Myxococcales bacterium]|nr:IS66 family transposase [Myxococcales bacterium]